MSTVTVPYSKFLRGPSATIARLEAGEDVVLERRDAENFVLMRAQRFNATLGGISIAARAMRQLIKRDPALAQEIIADELPWINWLLATERTQCMTDLISSLEAGAETQNMVPFAQTMLEWLHTAEVWADPDLSDRLGQTLPGDGERIERPGT